ncbi:MAG: hypothetical protein PUE72_03955 [Lachnospiraceae bacterium]|nr:hypothetical protein [Lachnospiraceae bacterium]
MKKITGVLAAIAVFICMSIAALAGENEPEKTVIGVSVYNLNDTEVQAFRNYLENYIGITFDVDFLYSSGILTAEEEIEFIDELHKRGVKGIISFLSSDLEQVLPVCEAYGMYYVRGSGTISTEMYEKVKDNPYFLGTIGPSAKMEQEAAAEMAEYFSSKEEGKQNQYLIMSGGAGKANEMHRLRAVGILNQLKEDYGLTYEKPVEELVMAQDVEKIETGTDLSITLVPGYPSVDNLNEKLETVLADGENQVVLSVIGVNDFIETIDTYERTSRQDVQVGAIDCFTGENYELFNTKGYGGAEKLDYLVGKYGAIVAPSFVAIENAYEGFADEYREDGSAFRLEQSFWKASTPEEYNRQYALSIGMYYNTYSASDMMKVMKAYTPDADFKAFKEFTEK